MDGAGIVGELITHQRAVNEWMAQATPAERAAAAKAQLRFIAEVEDDDWLRWLVDGDASNSTP